MPHNPNLGPSFEDSFKSVVPHHPFLVEMIELNVGGKIFMTYSNQVLLSFLSIQPPLFDSQRRIFIDRDPTHFRWILTYLRDRKIDSRPEDYFHLLELIIEAKHYQLAELVKLLEQPAFLYERPSYKGIFMVSFSWDRIIPIKTKEMGWNYLGVQFHPNSRKVTFLSIDLNPMPNTMHLQFQEVITTNLVVLLSATTELYLGDTRIYIEFKWKKTQSHPQLMINIRTPWSDSACYEMQFLSAQNYPET